MSGYPDTSVYGIIAGTKIVIVIATRRKITPIPTDPWGYWKVLRCCSVSGGVTDVDTELLKIASGNEVSNGISDTKHRGFLEKMAGLGFIFPKWWGKNWFWIWKCRNVGNMYWTHLSVEIICIILNWVSRWLRYKKKMKMFRYICTFKIQGWNSWQIRVNHPIEET